MSEEKIEERVTEVEEVQDQLMRESYQFEQRLKKLEDKNG